MNAESFEALDRCPVCGGASLRPWRRGTFDRSSLGPETVRITDAGYGRIWDLSLCRDCRHLFANPRPTAAFLNSLYGSLEDPLYDEEAPGRSRNFNRVLDRLEACLSGRGRLLDVGAATGILMDLARRRGFGVEGVEPSAWAVRIALEKHGFHLQEAALETARLPQDFYDVVTMIDFIEHTALPAGAVRKAAEALRPGGVLCLVTPDVRSLAARLAGKRWWHFRPAHLAYFSDRSLEVLLRGAGFTVVRRARYAWTFSAHYIASRLPLLRALARRPGAALFLKRIPIKLALGDSFEIYARKERPA